MLVSLNAVDAPRVAIRVCGVPSGADPMVVASRPLTNIDPPLENVLPLPGCCQPAAPFGLPSRRTPTSAASSPQIPSRPVLVVERFTTTTVWTVVLVARINSSALGDEPLTLPEVSPSKRITGRP